MTKLDICHACEFYRIGGKSRIALEHTCGKIRTEPKKIKIPKVDDNDLIDVLINRTGIIDTGKAYRLTTKKQIIEGIEVPAGYEFWTPQCVINREFSSTPVAHVPGFVVNKMLRFLVMEKLRNNA